MHYRIIHSKMVNNRAMYKALRHVNLKYSVLTNPNVETKLLKF